MDIIIDNNSGIDAGSMKKPEPKVGEAKWRDIADLITRWARKQPMAARDLRWYIQEKKEEMSDTRHGVLTDGAMAGGRIGIAIDPNLLQYIQTFYPGFLENDKNELHEFMKRFPNFNIRSEV